MYGMLCAVRVLSLIIIIIDTIYVAELGAQEETTVSLYIEWMHGGKIL